MGFVFGLIILGGFTLLSAMINRRSPPVSPKPLLQSLLPYIGYGCLFAGLGALLLSMGLGAMGESFFRSHIEMSGVGFFAGYVLGGCGGAALGFKKASKLNGPR